MIQSIISYYYKIILIYFTNIKLFDKMNHIYSYDNCTYKCVAVITSIVFSNEVINFKISK